VKRIKDQKAEDPQSRRNVFNRINGKREEVGGGRRLLATQSVNPQKKRS